MTLISIFRAVSPCLCLSPSESHFWVCGKFSSFLIEAWHCFLQVFIELLQSCVLCCLFCFVSRCWGWGMAPPFRLANNRIFFKRHITNDTFWWEIHVCPLVIHTWSRIFPRDFLACHVRSSPRSGLYAKPRLPSWPCPLTRRIERSCRAPSEWAVKERAGAKRERWWE